MDILQILICVSSFYLGDVNTQVEPSSRPSRIEGPAIFVTDGARELTLTYHTNTTVAGSYVWIVPGSRPCPAQVDNTCTFCPALEDDGKSVICVVQGSSFEVLSRASYNINLSYPPPSKPRINSTLNSRQPLKQGDVITCSVSGGKPSVTSVTFHCNNPTIADREDDVSNDGSTVSSDVIVETSQDTNQNMTCTCSALWQPEPELYGQTTQRQFDIQATTVQPSSQSSRIEGPDTFVTNGTRELTLNHHTSTTVSGSYVWIVPGSRPCSAQVDNTCTFRPALEDDGERVICAVQSPSFEVLSQASYEINLSYPPQSSPNISLSPNTTQPLKQGDVITCSVPGGKPRVTNVTFHCQNPDLADQEDDVSDDGSTVSSKITVDTSTATEQDMTCNCLAFWEPEPGLYQHTTVMAFQLEWTELEPNGNENLSPGAVAAVVLGTLLFVALLLFTGIIVKKWRSMKSCRKTDEQVNDFSQSAAESQDLRQIPDLSGSRQQQQQHHEHQPQPTSIQSQEHDTVANEDTNERHTYVNEGNTYDVLQRHQHDDGRTYTTLMMSPRASNGRHPAGVSRTAGMGDYEIP